MSKKTQERKQIRELTLDELGELYSAVENFKSSDFDEHSLVDESVRLHVYSDGTFAVSGSFESHHFENIEL